MKDRLTPLTIPSRKGRLAIVTGASSGIGRATARALGLAGADVVLAVRNPDKGEQVAEQLRAEHPEGTHTVARLDTADLESVRTFADASARGTRITVVARASDSFAGRESRERPGSTWSVMASSARAFSSGSVTFSARPRTTTER